MDRTAGGDRRAPALVERFEDDGRVPARVAAVLGEGATRALVVAAHPDDEVVGAGALIGRLADCTVIHVTDGAPRDARLVPPAERGSRGRYARRRRDEAVAALALAGLGPERVRSLGVVDQEAAYALPSLARRLADALATLRPDLVLTHPYEGGHPDHDAAAFAVHAAVALRRRAGAEAPRVVEFASYHREGRGLAVGVFLPGAGAPEVACELAPPVRTLKRRMLACFVSQQETLAPFTVDHERFRIAPAYDFARPPHSGPLWYECLGWPLSGLRWRALALRALRALDLEDDPCP